MHLNYIRQNSLSSIEFNICQAYYENTGHFTSALLHLQQLCNHYPITINQLVAITQKVKVYHPYTTCQTCHIAQRIKQPDYHNLQHLEQLDYICDDCQAFINTPNQTQYFANTPLLTNQQVIDDLPY